MLSAALIFLALADSDQLTLVCWIVGGLMALGPVLSSYIRVYDWFRGTAFDASQFVTRKEMNALRAERDAQIAASLDEIKADFNRMEAVLKELNRDMPAIHRALGRLEGHDEIERLPRVPR